MTHRSFAVLVFVVALALRVGLLWALPDLLPAATDKAGRYDRIAHSIMEGEGFSIDRRATAAAGPVYPVLLSIAYSVWGSDIFRLRLMLSVLDAAQCALFYLVARQHFGAKAAVMSAAFLACCPYFIMSIYSAGTETVFLFLMAVFVFFWSYALKTRSRFWQAISGALCGVTALCRPTTLLLPLFVAPVFLIRYPDCRKRGFKHFVLFAGAALMMVAPWICRNQLVFHRFVPIQTLGGTHLYMATGVKKSDVKETWGPEGDLQYYRLAIREIAADIGGHARRTAARVATMWYRTHSGRYEEYLKVANFSLLALAALGVLVNYSNWRSQAYLILIVLYFVAVHSVMIVIFRYMLVTIPILAMFAASFLNVTVSKAAEARRKRHHKHAGEADTSRPRTEVG